MKLTMDTLPSRPCETGRAGGSMCPELKRHQKTGRAIIGCYLHDDTVLFQVLKYLK